MKASNRTVSGAARAQWLSELSRAIDEAQWLAWRIGVVEGRNAQALELYVQLELVSEIYTVTDTGLARGQNPVVVYRASGVRH